jgi:N-acetyl-gamma-glutamyl-phosphate reductase
VTRVHVVGASGYAASEAIRILRKHPNVRLGALESATHAGERIGAHAPSLRALDRTYDAPGTTLAVLAEGDVALHAGRAHEAAALVPALLARGARVIDFSDRFRSTAVSGEAVYGFPERYADAIARARLVANPGCYPTATLLAVWPLEVFAAGIEQIVVDAKSGISGAGRAPLTGSLFAEVAGDVRAYGLAGHRHAPEIVAELAALGIEAPLTFTPHVVPLSRGMLVDAYAICSYELADDALAAAYRRCYASNPFVRLLPPNQAPNLPGLVGTNDAEIHLSRSGRVVRVLCAIDNLGRGAAGQAVANLNLMLGLPTGTALDDRIVA